jgi:hypothetical protein
MGPIRVALIYLLSQAVMKRSRDVYLGRNFTEWMRRLGYQTVSYGPRGTANLMREQVDRLLACEWQIRWDGTETDDNAFAVRDVKISNEYAGSLDKNGTFAREIRMSEVFYSHLIEHAVPLNEVAIRELKGRQRRSISIPILPIASHGSAPTRGRSFLGINWQSTSATRLTASAFVKRCGRRCSSSRRFIPMRTSISPAGRWSFIRLQRRWSVNWSDPICDLLGRQASKRHRDHRFAPFRRQRNPQRNQTNRFTHSRRERFPMATANRRFGVSVSLRAILGQSTIWPTHSARVADIKRPRTDTEWMRLWEAFVIKYADRRKNRPDD